MVPKLRDEPGADGIAEEEDDATAETPAKPVLAEALQRRADSDDGTIRLAMVQCL